MDGGQDGDEGDGGLDEQRRMGAKRAEGCENADEAAREFGRLAGEEDIRHGRAGEMPEAGPGGGAEGVKRGGGETDGGQGGVSRGDGGVAEQV